MAKSTTEKASIWILCENNLLSFSLAIQNPNPQKGHKMQRESNKKKLDRQIDRWMDRWIGERNEEARKSVVLFGTGWEG